MVGGTPELAHFQKIGRMSSATTTVIHGAEARMDAAALIVHTKVADAFWLVVSVSLINVLICVVFVQP